MTTPDPRTRPSSRTRTSSLSRASSSSRAGAPRIGASIPAWTIGLLGQVAGLAGAAVAIGPSGWFVVAAILAVAAAVLPRGPFGALLVVQLTVASVYGGGGASPARVAVLLLTTHLVLVTGMLWSWAPRAARVQLRALRPAAIRFVVVQVGVQAVGFTVSTLVDGSGLAPAVGVGVGIAAVVALLALVVGVLLPTISDRGDR